jgi:hypothetical protein
VGGLRHEHTNATAYLDTADRVLIDFAAKRPFTPEGSWVDPPHAILKWLALIGYTRGAKVILMSHLEQSFITRSLK